MPLNFGGRKRSGAFDTVWPPASLEITHVTKSIAVQCVAAFKSVALGRCLPARPPARAFARAHALARARAAYMSMRDIAMDTQAGVRGQGNDKQ